MSGGSVLGALVAALVAVSPPVATTTYADAAGDAGSAPDIVAVTVACDAGAGTVQLSVTTTGLPVDPLARPDVNVFLDADDEPGTGSLSGAEYWLRATADDWSLYRWNAVEWWQKTRPPASMSFARNDNTVGWRFDRSDLGVAPRFAFTTSAAAYDRSGFVVGLDFAPDTGAWTATLPARASGVAIAGPPNRPVHAGRRTVLRALVTRTDTAAAPNDATVTWLPTVDGRALAHADRFAGGIATSSIAVPKRLRGRHLRVQITAATRDGVANKVVVLPIR